MGKRVENPRVERFTLVLTEEERRQLEQLAGTKGVSMSEFVRIRLFADRSPQQTHSRDPAEGETGE